LVAIDRKTNDTFGIATSLPISCTLVNNNQFAFMLARSLELADAPFDAINREVEQTSFMLTFENLSRP